jgi:multicomponent Na+:H+ antiporter subunit E
MAKSSRFGSRMLAVAGWAEITWLLLTWTLTWEQQLTGVAIALAVGAAMAPLGDVPGPWTFLRPRRLGAAVVLLGASLGSVVRANLSLTRRIWSPSRPLSSGMLVLPTRMRSDAGIAATALVSSLIVDNQCVDLDRSANVLQYHVVAVPPGDAESRTEQINAPTERRLLPLLTGAGDSVSNAGWPSPDESASPEGSTGRLSR